MAAVPSHLVSSLGTIKPKFDFSKFEAKTRKVAITYIASIKTSTGELSDVCEVAEDDHFKLDSMPTFNHFKTRCFELVAKRSTAAAAQLLAQSHPVFVVRMRIKGYGLANADDPDYNCEDVWYKFLASTAKSVMKVQITAGQEISHEVVAHFKAQTLAQRYEELLQQPSILDLQHQIDVLGLQSFSEDAFANVPFWSCAGLFQSTAQPEPPVDEQPAALALWFSEHAPQLGLCYARDRLPSSLSNFTFQLPDYDKFKLSPEDNNP